MLLPAEESLALPTLGAAGLGAAGLADGMGRLCDGIGDLWEGPPGDGLRASLLSERPFAFVESLPPESR